jgi:hypothetical protein
LRYLSDWNESSNVGEMGMSDRHGSYRLAWQEECKINARLRAEIEQLRAKLSETERWLRKLGFVDRADRIKLERGLVAWDT